MYQKLLQSWKTEGDGKITTEAAAGGVLYKEVLLKIS